MSSNPYESSHVEPERNPWRRTTVILMGVLLTGLVGLVAVSVFATRKAGQAETEAMQQRAAAERAIEEAQIEADRAVDAAEAGR